MVFQGAMNAFNPVRRSASRSPSRWSSTASPTGRRRRPASGELLEPVGIARERARTLSARVLRRHASARGDRDGAGLLRRSILLADEPTTALDVMVQAQILELLTHLSTSSGSRSSSSRTTCRSSPRRATARP